MVELPKKGEPAQTGHPIVEGDKHMKTRSRILPLAAAALLIGACADTQTETFAPQFARGGGNAHFQADATDCAVTGAAVDCVFKIVGLGKNSGATVTLTGGMTITYTCVNNGNQSPPPWQGLQQQVTAGPQNFESDKNGNITGSISISASAPPATDLCPSHTWSVDATNSRVGNWTLSALTKTGTITYIPS
jgi:hypothetical protein